MPATTVVIFGATGDLARHKLIPALAALDRAGRLDPSLRILAIGRRDYDDAAFRSFLRETTDSPLLGRIDYFKMDFRSPERYPELRERCGEQVVCYLAVEPDAVPTVAGHLAGAGFGRSAEGWFRMVLEKPFGHDLASAKELDATLAGLFKEEQLYRIDHYLAKETVQNILAFRFANGLFEPVWDARSIDHIQITVAEAEGIGTRGSFYDQTGAVRDLLQNHMLQLLAVLTMDQPEAFSFEKLSRAIADRLRTVSLDAGQTVLGQYDGYRSEQRVASDSRTETYVATVARIDAPRWQGVPIYLRTGKRLARRVSEISVQFKEPEQQLFQFSMPEHRSNLLTFRLQPDEGIDLELGVKVPEQNMQVRPVALEFCYATAFGRSLPDAYERLLLDVLEGDRSLTLCAETIEASWRIVDALLAGKDEMPLLPYPAGSWGPAEADGLVRGAGRRWLAHESTVCNGVTLPKE